MAAYIQEFIGCSQMDGNGGLAVGDSGVFDFAGLNKGLALLRQGQALQAMRMIAVRVAADAAVVYGTVIGIIDEWVIKTAITGFGWMTLLRIAGRGVTIVKPQFWPEF